MTTLAEAKEKLTRESNRRAAEEKETTRLDDQIDNLIAKTKAVIEDAGKEVRSEVAPRNPLDNSTYDPCDDFVESAIPNLCATCSNHKKDHRVGKSKKRKTRKQMEAMVEKIRESESATATPPEATTAPKKKEPVKMLSKETIETRAGELEVLAETLQQVGEISETVNLQIMRLRDSLDSLIHRARKAEQSRNARAAAALEKKVARLKKLSDEIEAMKGTKADE